MTYVFGPYRLETRTHRLRRGGEVLALPDRQIAVLSELLAHAGHVVFKDALIAAGWADVAVTDNSLEQAISALRRALGAPPNDAAYIETVARRGYRFAAPVTTEISRQTDDVLSALVAPYRALVGGRAALETLDREAVFRAVRTFEEIVEASPDYGPGHLGLANALALSFEGARAGADRNPAAVAKALHHAAEACRVDPEVGEAWATLSLLCYQSRDYVRATAAAQRAVALEPDNWRHHLRMAYVSWGESRLRAAQRVLKLLPGFPFAHWLAATVHVARMAMDAAEHELRLGADAQDRQPGAAPFRGVGLHLLRGLVQLAGGDESRAMTSLERELGSESSQHIYGREAAANVHCAIAAIHVRHGRMDDAVTTLQRARQEVDGHAVAIAATTALSQRISGATSADTFERRTRELRAEGAQVEAAMAEAVYEAVLGRHDHAARLVHEALAAAPPGSVAWALPVEPFLHVSAHHAMGAPALSLLRSRAL